VFGEVEGNLFSKLDALYSLNLRQDIKDAPLRELIFKEFMKSPGNAYELLWNIADFKPSEKEIPALMQLGEQLSKMPGLAGYFPLYISSLEGTGTFIIPSFLDTLKRPQGFQPLHIPLDEKLSLLRTSLLAMRSQTKPFKVRVDEHDNCQRNWNSWEYAVEYPKPCTELDRETTYSHHYKRAERVFLQKEVPHGDLFDVQSEKIPGFMRKLHEATGAGKNTVHADWLRYSAAHILGVSLTAQQESSLAGIYQYMTSSPFTASGGRARYIVSQLIGVALSDPEDNQPFFKSVDQFHNHKAAGVLFHHATLGDPELCASFSAFLGGLQAQPQDQVQRMQEATASFSEFAASESFSPELKKQWLSMYRDEIAKDENQTESCLSMMGELGKICKTVNIADPKLCALYLNWLPSCQSVQDIKQAASPNRVYLFRVLAENVKHERPIPLDSLRQNDVVGPLDTGIVKLNSCKFTDEEIRSWTRPLIRDWLDTALKHLPWNISGYNFLCTKSTFLSSKILGLGHAQEEAFLSSSMLEHCSFLKDSYAVARTEDAKAWGLLAGLVMIEMDPALAAKAFVQGPLKRLEKFRGGWARLQPTLCLHRSLRTAELAADYKKFSSSFTAHSRIFAPSLFQLAKSAAPHGDALSIKNWVKKGGAGIGSFAELVKNPEFRETPKALPLLNLVNQVELTGMFKPDEKAHLLNSVAEMALGKRGMMDKADYRGVFPEMAYMTGALAFIAQDDVDQAEREAMTAILQAALPALTSAGKTICKLRDALARAEAYEKRAENVKTALDKSSGSASRTFPSRELIGFGGQGGTTSQEKTEKLAKRADRLAEARVKAAGIRTELKQAIVEAEQAMAPAAKLLMKHLFSVPDEKLDGFVQDYGAYMTSSRDPAALLTYAACMQSGLADPSTRDEVMHEIALIAKCAAANDGGVTLDRIRNDTAGCEHNGHIEKNAEKAWVEWKKGVAPVPIELHEGGSQAKASDISKYLQERIVHDKHAGAYAFPIVTEVLEGPVTAERVEAALHELDNGFAGIGAEEEKHLLLVLHPDSSPEQAMQHLQALQKEPTFRQRPVQFRNDIADLLTLLQPTASKRTLHASISGKLEDLVLIGTEVRGSCQNIYGTPSFNIALPGYVLDGKYLSAQLADDSGQVESRRMLRLLWNEDPKNPVIFVEREYSNPGVGAEAKATSMEQVYQLARRMGVMIATRDEELVEDLSDAEMVNLNAYGTPRPYEYVDALGKIENHGNYVIEGAYLIDPNRRSKAMEESPV